jgi:hypothetical protein
LAGAAATAATSCGRSTRTTTSATATALDGSEVDDAHIVASQEGCAANRACATCSAAGCAADAASPTVACKHCTLHHEDARAWVEHASGHSSAVDLAATDHRICASSDLDAQSQRVVPAVSLCVCQISQHHTCGAVVWQRERHRHAACHETAATVHRRARLELPDAIAGAVIHQVQHLFIMKKNICELSLFHIQSVVHAPAKDCITALRAQPTPKGTTVLTLGQQCQNFKNHLI